MDFIEKTFNQIKNLHWIEENIRTELNKNFSFKSVNKDHRFYLVKYKNKICAFYMIKENDKNIIISKFIVFKKFRRNGIGELIVNKLKESEEFIDKKKLVFIKKTNPGAIKFWRKCGFKKIRDMRGIIKCRLFL